MQNFLFIFKHNHNSKKWCCILDDFTWGAGMAQWEARIAQWWERSPPTIVARILFESGVICRLNLLLVLAFTKGFSPTSMDFLSLQKPISPILNSTRLKDPHETHLTLMWLPPLTTTWKRILPTPPIWFQMAYLIKTTNVQIPAKKLPNAQGLRREGAPRRGGVGVMLMSTYI